ncbi:MAG TPA: cytochrome c [Xanthomonadales bacterium]|nr:cytochrome c [Xanthomonadales bacterium]
MWIRTTLKWAGYLLGGVLALAIIAATVINVIISRDLNRSFDVPTRAIEVPTGDEAIAEGERLARIRGCAGGCHGIDSRGRVFFELPGGSQIVAPNAVRVAQQYSTEDFERVVRHGVRPDGTSVLLPMPSSMFYHLSDEDLGAILAYLRSLDPGDEDLPETHLNPIGRLMIYQFKRSEGTILASEKIDHQAERLRPGGPTAEHRGEYLAITVCTECHGEDLRGSPGFGMPDLIVATAYSPEDFQTLMRTGKAIGDRELGLMGEVAQGRFSHFTDTEINDLYSYLLTLGSAEPVEGAR